MGEERKGRRGEVTLVRRRSKMENEIGVLAEKVLEAWSKKWKGPWGSVEGGNFCV